jgi:hypothetical protein
MSFWNRSSYLMIARLLPIVLVLSAGFAWKYEKRIRHQAEIRLKSVANQLAQSQLDLADSKRQTEAANGEKHFLIQQLGERDEHIRRLLAEMIRLLSGSGSVDLGEVVVLTKTPGAWDGVHQEMQNIVSQQPIGSSAIAAAQVMAPAAGLRQMQVEQAAIPAMMQQVPMNAALAGPSPAKLFDSLQSREGQILTVNGQHRFVVISQGSRDGLQQDAEFDIFSDAGRLGRVKLGTVYDRISTASILDGDTKSFREGSSIRLEPATA